MSRIGPIIILIVYPVPAEVKIIESGQLCGRPWCAERQM